MDHASGTIPYKNIVFSDPVDFSKPIPHESIEGQTVLITGGASGIGAACATEWAKHGANIIIGDLNENLGVELIARLRRTTKNPNHHFLPLDVTSWQSQALFFKQAANLSPHGGIDCVLANAGIASPVEAAIFEDPPNYQTIDDPPAPALKTIDVNLSGVLYTTHLALSYLSRNPGSQSCSTSLSPNRRDRHLILLSSIAGICAFPSQSLYGASKHGVVGMFRAMRITSPLTHGIRVNMINPYFVATPLLGTVGATLMAGSAMAKIEDVVDAMTRLVADKTIIGRALVIGARGYAEQIQAVGLKPPASVDKGQAVWDVHGEDFEQTEFFTRRIVGIINIISATRSWGATIWEIGASLTAPLRRFLGG